MSTFGRQYTDAGLTSTLDHWLDEGPTSAPDFTVEAALRTVATTRQRQLRGRLLRMADFHGPVVPLSLTLVGITAIVMVAVGLGMNNGAVPGVEDSPSPSVATSEPVPTDIPYGYVMFRNQANGYEIAVPRTWEVQVEPAYGEPHPGVTRFAAGAENRPPLVVSIGTTTGTVFLCQHLACSPEVARSLDDIESEIRSDWPLPTGAMPEMYIDPEYYIDERIVSTTLGGEPARFRYPINPQSRTILGFTTTCTAYALHAGRPVVLSFPCGRYFTRDQDGGEPAGLGQLNAIIASFRFLDAGAVAEPTTVPVEFGALMQFPMAGIELDLPDLWWSTSPADSPTGLTFSRRPAPFGTAVIFAGDDRGRVRTCLGPAGPWETCDFVVADSVADLEEAVAPVGADDHEIGVPGQVSRDTVMLDGEEAIRLMIEDYEYPAHSGEWITYIVAVHDGRPYILRFHTKDGAHSAEWLAEFLVGFRFLDESPDGAFPELGFELAMEEGWTVRISETDPNVVRGRTRFGTFMIEAADGDGLVQACITPDEKWPRLACSWGGGETLDELVDPYFDRMGPGKDLALDGEPARRFDVRSYEYPAQGGQHVVYIVALHDGRPFILRFHTSQENWPEGRLADALDRFRWTD